MRHKTKHYSCHTHTHTHTQTHTDTHTHTHTREQLSRGPDSKGDGAAERGGGLVRAESAVAVCSCRGVAVGQGLTLIKACGDLFYWRGC